MEKYIKGVTLGCTAVWIGFKLYDWLIGDQPIPKKDNLTLLLDACFGNEYQAKKLILDEKKIDKNIDDEQAAERALNRLLHELKDIAH